MSENTRRALLKTSVATAAVAAGAVPVSCVTGRDRAGSDDPSGTSARATYTLTRRIPVETGYDVVVCGGGPAGTAAAVCAARLGAKVLLAEATGCLGGMGTSGLVTAFDPMANGTQLLVGGFMNEVVTTLYKRGFLGPRERPEIYEKRYHHWTMFQAEGYKLVLDEFATAAGVEVRFFTRVIDADADPKTGSVNGVVLHNIEGYRFVKAKAYVDGTGDAVLADLCGTTCREAGRDTPNIMPATLPSLHAGLAGWTRRGKQKRLLKAIEDGHFTQPDKHLPGMSLVSRNVGYLNGGHLFNLNALRCRSLSDGMMLGRRIVREYVAFYRKYMGCENIELVTTATLMGVRESRRVLGEYELNIDDYRRRREFPDQIGIFNKYVDIHPYDTSEKEYQRFLSEKNRTGKHKPGEYFGIPYAILVPKGWQNLWVAGRCASSDVQVQGSIRVQPAASMMGQAAGTAAVQSIRTARAANDLDTEHLVTSLRKAGAILPQKTLSRTMTRS